MKSEWISFLFFSLAGIIHIGFFVLESILFQKNGSHKLLGVTESEHAAVKVWAINQGFYNLFLAIGLFTGLSFIFQKQIMLAGVLTGYCGVSMAASGAVLWFTAPKSRKFALLQMLPPLIGFMFLFFHIANTVK